MNLIKTILVSIKSMCVKIIQILNLNIFGLDFTNVRLRNVHFSALGLLLVV